MNTNKLKAGMPVNQEVRDYYKRTFGYDDVHFVMPGEDGVYGKIILKLGDAIKVIRVVGAFAAGFDGIDSVLQYQKDHWDEQVKASDS